MPTLLAMLLASCASFLTTHLPLPPWMGYILSSGVWVVVFIFTKQFLRTLRP